MYVRIVYAVEFFSSYCTVHNKVTPAVSIYKKMEEKMSMKER